MLTIKDLLDNGIYIQERATNVTLFSDIENLEELSVDDIITNNYCPKIVEPVWGSASYDLWLEYDEEGVFISFDDFKILMKEWQSVDDAIDYINENK